MSPKTLIVMFVAAVALTAGALTFDSARDTRAAWAKADELVFPDLQGALERAARLRIESAEGTTTVELRDGEWVVAERGGYLGRADEVGRLFTSLAFAKRVEPKTEDPEKYEKLGLAGFDDDASPTVRLTVEDAGGAVLADLFVGSRSFRSAGESWYVREPEDEATWTVEAKLRTPKRTGEWLVTDLVDVARDRIAAVRVAHADGEPVELVRPDADATAFDVANLPEGRSPKNDRSGAAFLGSLAALRLSDVRPASEADFPEPAPTTTSWTTFDGLVVTAELAEDGEGEDAELLCRFSASLDEDRLPGADMGPELPSENEEGAGDETESEDEADPFALPEPEAKTREEVEAERDELAERFDGWVFVLPSWKKTSFLIEMEELLEPLPEPDPEPEGENESESESETGTDSDDGDGAPPPTESEGEGGR